MIILAGKNNIAVEVLWYLIFSLKIPKEEVRVICNKTDLGVDSWQRSFKRYAKYIGVQEIKLEDFYNMPECDIFLSLEFDRLVKVKKIKSNCRLYNIHFSQLPAYKGMYTSIWPILNGEKTAGVTLHVMDQGIDTGDIISQVSFSLGPYETARSLYHRFLVEGAKLVSSNLLQLIKGNITAFRQSSNASSYYSKSSLPIDNLMLDLQQTAACIERQTRAYNFREYQYPRFEGAEIIGARILDEKSTCTAGQIIREDEISIKISSIDYDVLLFKSTMLDKMHGACVKDDLELVQEYLCFFPGLKYLTYNSGWTWLMTSAFFCSKKVFFHIYEDGLAQLRGYKGTTLLMYAKSGFVNTGCDFIFQYLLYKDCSSIDLVDCNGKTIKDYCLENEENEALALMEKLNGDGV